MYCPSSYGNTGILETSLRFDLTDWCLKSRCIQVSYFYLIWLIIINTAFLYLMTLSITALGSSRGCCLSLRTWKDNIPEATSCSVSSVIAIPLPTPSCCLLDGRWSCELVGVAVSSSWQRRAFQLPLCYCYDTITYTYNVAASKIIKLWPR